MKPELDETNRIHTSCKICLWKIYWGPFNFHFTYQIPNRHWIKPLLPAHALRRKPTAPSPGDYTNHFGIKSCRRKKNNYSHKSSPSHFSQIVMVHLSTCTPLSSVIRVGRDVGKNEFSLCFRHLLAILKTYKSLAIFFSLQALRPPELLHLFGCSPATTKNGRLGHHYITLVINFWCK